MISDHLNHPLVLTVLRSVATHLARARAPLGLRPVARPAVLPRALAPSSTVRQEEATNSQPRVTAGAAGWRRPSGPGVLDCAARSVARATQLWRIGSWADHAEWASTMTTRAVTFTRGGRLPSWDRRR